MKRTIMFTLFCLFLIAGISNQGFCQNAVKPEITGNYRVYDPRTKLAYNGFRIVYPAYEAVIALSEMWGYYSFELLLAGERVVYTRQFQVTEPSSGKEIFSATGFHKPKSSEFLIRETPSEIQWNIAPALKKEINYGGGIIFEPNRISLTDSWVWQADTEGTVTASILELGLPLLAGCGFQARLFDGTELAGNIPFDLPEKPTCFAGDKGSQSVREITLDTKKGKVKISFLPDAYTDIPALDGLSLSTRLVKGRKPEERQYEFTSRFPAGPKNLPRRYTILFEFPD